MTRLAKEITLYGLIMVVIGSCIGSGIFLTPSQIATHAGTPFLIILVWIIGGLVTLTGALTFGELGGLFPKAGGVYVYLKEAYGDWMGFLYGWAYLLVITSGAIAGLAIAFAYYLGFFIPLTDSGKVITGVLAISALTLVNIFRAKFGEIFSNIFTSLKIIGILIIIIAGLFLAYKVSGPHTDTQHLPLLSGSGMSGFGLALVGVLFSFGGWQHASYLAGETRNPGRNVPLAMIIGAISVSIIYLLVNISYLLLLPVEEIAASEKVAADAVSRVLPWGGMLVAAIISVSTLGTIGIFTLSTPRIYYAMADDGIFFKSMAKIHTRYKTPVNAILIQSFWAILLLIFWGTFEDLITYVVFADWIFFTLAAIGIFIFRKRMPGTARPYKTLGYPFTPAIFIIITSWFVINTLVNRPLHSGLGLLFLVLGIPVYLLFKKKNNKIKE